jgi:hypothetical protein
MIVTPEGPPDGCRPRLVFMHLPKTGGTTLHHLLQPHFAPDETCPDRFAELYRHTDAELARWRFFSGHFRMDELRRIPPPAFRVTLLRDPRERILSLYRFWRRIGLSFPSPPPGPRAARETDLADFLRCRVPDVAEAVDNAVARGLAGGVFVRPGQGWVFAAPDGNGQRPAGRAEVAALARDGLLGLDLVGFTGRLDAAYAAIAADLGLPPATAPVAPRLNAGDAPRADLVPSPPPPEVTEEAAAALDEATALDREVVALARDLLAPGEAVARPAAAAARRGGPPA